MLRRETLVEIPVMGEVVDDDSFCGHPPTEFFPRVLVKDDDGVTALDRGAEQAQAQPPIGQAGPADRLQAGKNDRPPGRAFPPKRCGGVRNREDVRDIGVSVVQRAQDEGQVRQWASEAASSQEAFGHARPSLDQGFGLSRIARRRERRPDHRRRVAMLAQACRKHMN